MSIARWIVSAFLILVSLYIGIGQWCAIASLSRKVNSQGEPRGYSMIPLIGGILGMIGCLVAPSPFVNRLWWLPLIIDPGCALLFCSVAVFLAIAWIKRLLKIQ